MTGYEPRPIRSAGGGTSRRVGPIGTAAALAVLAAAAWVAAGLLDLRTEVTLRLFDGTVHWTVSDSTLSTRTGALEVERVTVRSHGGLLPNGGEHLRIDDGSGERHSWALPVRFPSIDGFRQAVGDWWVDEFLPEGKVFAAEVDLDSDFLFTATFHGRFHQDVTIDLEGPSGVMCSFRRGLLNNDLFIKNADGWVLAAGSIDPQPIARLGAALSTLLRAVAGAALLVCIWTLFGGIRGSAVATAQAEPNRLFLTAVLLVAAAGAALSYWTAVGILEGLPHLPDEVVYRLQSHWLLEGRLSAPEPNCPDEARIPLTYLARGRWFGHYPPGWPLVLAPGFAVGLPWAVPVMLRLVNIFLVGLLGLRLGGRWAGLGAAALAATSPLATLLFSSTMPHAGSSTFLLAALLLCLPDRQSSSPLRWMLVGLLFGLAFAVRPLTAVAAATPTGIFLFAEITRGRRHPRDLLLVLASGLVASVPTLAANALITGSPWAFPYSLARGEMVAADNFAFGVRNFDTLIASLGPLVHGWMWPWAQGAILLALPFSFAAVPFLTGKHTREDRLLLAVALAVPVSLLWSRAHGLHGYGPRYLFLSACLVWILTARGAAVLASTENRRWSAAGMVLALLILSSAVALPARLLAYRGYNDVSLDLVRGAPDVPSCAVIVIPGDDWRGWVAAEPWRDSSDPDEPVFAADTGDHECLRLAHPDRTLYRWTADPVDIEPVAGPAEALELVRERSPE